MDERPSIFPRIRLFYVLYFASVGIYYPFFTPYLRGLGFTGDQIGTAQMASAIASVPTGLLWGALSDRLGAPARALVIVGQGAFVAAALLLFVRTPAAIVLVMLAQGSVTPAIVPLLDTITIESIRGRSESYARVRLFGSLGFVATAQGFGVILAARGDHPADLAMPVAYASTLLAFALAVALLSSPSPSSGPRPHLVDMRALLVDRRLLLLLAAGAVHAATTASYQLLGVLVRDEGRSSTVTGAGMAFGVATEVLVMFVFPALERRFALPTLLMVAFGGTSLRWLLLSQSHDPAALIAVQGLHGLTFGLYWPAAIRTMEHLVSSRLRATGQALYSAITFALGGAIGYRLAGFGYDRLGGARPVYAWASLVELAPFVLAAMLRALRA